MGSSFVDTNSTYQNNTALDYGGAIYIGYTQTSTFIPSSAHVSNGFFANNNADSMGGAVFNDSGAYFKSENNTFDTNSTGWLGGAIFNGAVRLDPNGLFTPATFELSGENTFKNNISTWVGGAIFNTGKLQDSKDSQTVFDGNHSGDRGGALSNVGNFTNLSSMYPPSIVAGTVSRFTGTVIFQNNWSESRGGGAVANYSWDQPVEKIALIFEGTTTFKNNEAKGEGAHGGAILNSDSSLQLIGKQDFIENKASSLGGAIANFNGLGVDTSLVIRGDTTFNFNSAEWGGAVYNAASADIENATFHKNFAKVGNGGAIQNGAILDDENNVFLVGSLRVANSVFENNFTKFAAFYNTYAFGGGAVMNLTGSSFVSSNNSYLENSVGNAGGAIHNRQGESTLLVLEGKNYFEKNTANRGGGAIFNHGTLKVADSGCVTQFMNNSSSEGWGGGLFNVGGLYKFENNEEQKNTIAQFQGLVVFDGNKSAKGGGAVANMAKPTVTEDDTGNLVPGIYYSHVEVAFSGDAIFTNNSSKTDGGAVYNKDGFVTFKGTNSQFVNNEANVGGALVNVQRVEGVTPAKIEFAGNALFENNKAQSAAGAIYNNAEVVFGQGNHTFRGNSVEAGNGGAIYNLATGRITFGGSNYFETNTAQGTANDIFNIGRLVLGSEENVHNLTVLNGGITGSGTMELNSGNLVLGSGAQIHQSSFKAKAGTVTTIILSDAHHVHDKNVKHFDELADESGNGHDKAASAIGNNGFGIHTTGEMSIEKGAVLNIVSDDIKAGHTYLVAYNEAAPEVQAVSMVRAVDSSLSAQESVVVNPAGFDHEESSWKGENLISSNPLVKLERVEGDNINGYILVTSKDSNSVSIIEDLAGLDQVYFSWLSDLEDLRKRLGEVRLGADNGIWTKVSYSRYRASGLGDGKVKSTDYSIHVGADGTLYKNNGHKFFAGFSFKGGHTDMKAARAAGTGDLNHYTWKLYGTYVHEKGSYADIVASIGTFNNRFRGHHDNWTGLVHGDVNNWGAGISGEVGHQFRFLEESAGSFWFAEPQIQLSYFRVKGKNYETSNAIHVEQKSVNFLTGRVGVSAGKQFAYGADKKRYLQLSAKAGLIHEFAGDQKLRLNEKKLSADGKKNLFYYGADMDWQFADNHKLYLKVDRATGSGYRKDIQIQGGYRYSF